MLKTTKINNIKVVPVITNKREPDKIGGYNFFPEPYCNIAVLGKKHSGKSSTLFNILKACANKNTHVWLFSSTIHRDDTYKEIIKMLEEKKCKVDTFIHFIDEGGNILDEIIEELKNPDGQDEDRLTGAEPCLGVSKCSKMKPNFGGKILTEEEKEKATARTIAKEEKKMKKKKIYPDHIFCMDDLGSDMRHKSIDILLKTNRHFKSKVILLGHTLTDLNPGSRKQLDYTLIFKCFSEEKLKTLYTDLDLSIDFEDFKKAYEYATKDPYNFLYISTKSDELRRNFNEKIDIYPSSAE